MKAGRLLVSAELLKQALDLPQDCTFLGIMPVPERNCFELFISSQDLREVPEGGMISKELRATVHTETCEHGGILKRWIEWE